MNKCMKFIAACATAGLMLVAGCDKNKTAAGGSDDLPKFTLYWSEYPSWSAFGVAADKGIVAEVAAKHHIRIEMKPADYDTCMTLYGNNHADAVCVTNTDIPAPGLGRASVAIMPTSTSFGADACIVDPSIKSISDLKGVKKGEKLTEGNETHGLDKSVSQYAFYRNLQLQNLNPDDFPFSGMDPAAAAQAILNTGDSNKVHSIMVWNPFVLQTLRTRPELRVLFDSTSIKEEIIDCVVVGKDVLNRPGGEDFAVAINEIYYKFNKLLAQPDSGPTYVALGAKFSSLNEADMRKCCTQTRFYSTPDQGIALFDGKEFQDSTMPKILDWAVKYDVVPKKPTVGFNDPSAQINFTTKYMKQAQAN